MLSQFVGDTKLTSAADNPEGCNAIQRHVDKLRKSAHWNLIGFHKARF